MTIRLIGGVSLALLAGCGEPAADKVEVEGPTEQTGEPERVEAPSEESGEAVVDDAVLALERAAYARGMCAMCHGDSGAGTPMGPDLTDGVWQHGDGSVASIREILVSGVPVESFVDESYRFPMNPVDIGEDELDALAAYVWGMSR